MGQERIKDPTLTFGAMALLVAGNHPGSLRIVGEIIEFGPQIDPDDWLKGFSTVLDMDSLGIWDGDIYKLWNDVCRSNTSYLMALFRAYQLGQLAGVTEEAIKHAIANHGEGIDLDAAIAAVQKELPDFHVIPSPKTEVVHFRSPRIVRKHWLPDWARQFLLRLGIKIG